MAGKSITSIVSDIDNIVTKLIAIQERTKQSPENIDKCVFAKYVANVHGVIDDMEKCITDAMPCALDDNPRNGKVLSNSLFDGIMH